jgi:hypothetical protein
MDAMGLHVYTQAVPSESNGAMGLTFSLSKKSPPSYVDKYYFRSIAANWGR